MLRILNNKQQEKEIKLQSYSKMGLMIYRFKLFYSTFIYAIKLFFN